MKAINKDNIYYNSIDECIASLFGPGVNIESKRYVSGGDINDSYLCRLTDGTDIFLKVNLSKSYDFFRAEAAGLNALKKAHAIGVPKPLGYGRYSEMGGGFLMMEYLSAGNRIDDFWTVFATELSKLHKADTTEFLTKGRYGFTKDNYIGLTPQMNNPHDSWIEFFREERLLPQINMASDKLSSGERKSLDKLLEKLDDILIEPEKPSLIHGDLWGGNFVTGPDGKAWLIDPATYIGCAEADIAMTSLFGGFSSEFYEVYRQVGYLYDGYEDRKDLYNLYHLLNHLNLFDGGYKSSVMSIVRRYV